MDKENTIKEINGDDLIYYYIDVLSNANHALAIKTVSIKKLKEVIEEKENEVQELNNIIADKDKEIEKLKNEKEE